MVCEDIKVYIYEVGEYVSIFDGVPYSSYVQDGTNTVKEYPGMFPYQVDDKSQVFGKSILNYESYWYTKKTAGCVLFHSGEKQADGSYKGKKSYVENQSIYKSAACSAPPPFQSKVICSFQ